MTDTRLPESYLMDRRLARLTPEEFRGYISALMWTVANRTNGRIEPDDLALIPWFTGAAITRYELLGLWAEQGTDGWVIIDWEANQTSRNDLEVLDRARQAERDKKRRQRAEKRIKDAQSPGLSRGRVPGTAEDSDSDSDSDSDRSQDNREATGVGTDVPPPVLRPGEYTGGPVAWNRGAS